MEDTSSRGKIMLFLRSRDARHHVDDTPSFLVFLFFLRQFFTLRTDQIDHCSADHTGRRDNFIRWRDQFTVQVALITWACLRRHVN